MKQYQAPEMNCLFCQEADIVRCSGVTEGEFTDYDQIIFGDLS